MTKFEETDAKIEYERVNCAPSDLDLEPVTSEDEAL